ncbi:choline transport protein [Ophiocordyceps sinensis CO18]|uniref:Choline transport protein n=1 Tax=Ophiocordyceps sinensis (strain Co18 / CGMCC 3.14243) TaxID=911162 RepID=T5AAT2_OPHSC|nr:choline transport protein [Ophiocordyceps sinensis CO18]
MAPVLRAWAALLIVVSFLSVTTRIVTTLCTRGRLGVEDFLVVASMAFAIAQSGVVLYASDCGLGKDMHLLDAGHVSAVFKSQYAAEALFIVSLLLAKLSTTRAVLHMARAERRRLVLAAESMAVVWALASIIACLLQFTVEEPWDSTYGGLHYRAVVWLCISAVNVGTDAAITAVLLAMFARLQVTVRKRVLIMGVFGCRILVIPAVVCHAVYLLGANGSPNATLDLWQPPVIMQVVQCISIMVTCLPYLKPFLESLESGQMTLGIKEGIGSVDRSHPSDSNTLATLASRASHRRYEKLDRTAVTNTTTTTAVGDAPCPRSQQLEGIVIHQSWVVRVESKDTARGQD